MTDSAAALAKVVNDRMQERGITQRELADRSGVSVATLRKIQRGISQSRNRSTLANISRALGFPEGHLWEVWAGRADTEEESESSAVEELRSEFAELRQRVAAIETTLKSRD